VDNQSVDMCL